MLDRTPKIFISYSWDSETTRTITRELAETLLRDGINVVIDIWDLKPGQDMYFFMEQSVKSQDIDRVLMKYIRTHRINLLHGLDIGGGTPTSNNI